MKLTHSRLGRYARGRHVTVLLLGGFALVIVLLAADGFVGVSSILSIRASVAKLTDIQFRNVVLIDEVQKSQLSLNSVLYQLWSDNDRRQRQEIEREIAEIDARMSRLFASVPGTAPDRQYWRDVEHATSAVIAEAGRLLHTPLGVPSDFRGVMDARERLLSTTAALVRINHETAESTRKEIDRITTQQLWEDDALLTACLLVSCFCAWLILKTVTRLLARITEQTEELGRVSWQLLEKQETLAQRLSHELHDELGQSLTALKARFSGRLPDSADEVWVADCSSLLKESIRSVHEISQLLRPTILDDFGLNAALSWLCERFEDRTGIAVFYNCDFDGRLEEQRETHLFRIAQEALTNVARHANASRVDVRLFLIGSEVHLTIADNGVGLRRESWPSNQHFGLTGIKARARTLGGEMAMTTTPGGGTTVEVKFTPGQHDLRKANSYSAGR